MCTCCLSLLSVLSVCLFSVSSVSLFCHLSVSSVCLSPHLHLFSVSCLSSLSHLSLFSVSSVSILCPICVSVFSVFSLFCVSSLSFSSLFCMFVSSVLSLSLLLVMCPYCLCLSVCLCGMWLGLVSNTATPFVVRLTHHHTSERKASHQSRKARSTQLNSVLFHVASISRTTRLLKYLDTCCLFFYLFILLDLLFFFHLIWSALHSLCSCCGQGKGWVVCIRGKGNRRDDGPPRMSKESYKRCEGQL